MRRWYATVIHHSIRNKWYEIKAITELGAKREAWKHEGMGYIDHVIHLCECTKAQMESGQINDIDHITRVIGKKTRWIDGGINDTN